MAFSVFYENAILILSFFQDIHDFTFHFPKKSLLCFCFQAPVAFFWPFFEKSIECLKHSMFDGLFSSIGEYFRSQGC